MSKVTDTTGLTPGSSMPADNRSESPGVGKEPATHSQPDDTGNSVWTGRPVCAEGRSGECEIPARSSADEQTSTGVTLTAEAKEFLDKLEKQKLAELHALLEQLDTKL